MVQPKDPPVPYRPPSGSDVMVRVDAWAKERGCSRNAAMTLLLERGLVDPAVAVKPPVKPAPAKPVKAAPEPFRPVSALGEAFERKPYQKKGK